METMVAQAVLALGAFALLCLLALHVVSPEFQPSWRMVSEYALGRYNWLLSTFFVSWAASSALLAVLLASTVTGLWAWFGVAMLAVSAVGELFGGLFNIRHRLHGLAFAIGVPSLPIAALLLGHHLAKQPDWSAHAGTIILVSHLTWICVLAMGLGMALLFAGFRKAGLPMGPGIEPPEHLPAGVIAVGGYANRLLVVCDIGWLLLIAWLYLAIAGGNSL